MTFVNVHLYITDDTKKAVGHGSVLTADVPTISILQQQVKKLFSSKLDGVDAPDLNVHQGTQPPVLENPLNSTDPIDPSVTDYSLVYSVPEEPEAKRKRLEMGQLFLVSGSWPQAHSPPDLNKALDKTGVSAVYKPDIQLNPLSGNAIEREHVVETFETYQRFLLQDDSTKSCLTAEKRECYPLTVILGGPGVRKTFILRMLANHYYNDYVIIYFSFGNGTPLKDTELQQGDVDRAIAIRILYTLYSDLVTWEKFFDFCRNYQIPDPETAVEMVCEMTNMPDAPSLLLADETAYPLRLDAEKGFSFSGIILSTLQQLQRSTVKLHKSKSGIRPIYAVATSLRPDVVQHASVVNQTPIVFIDSPPFSPNAIRKLQENWTKKIFEQKGDFVSQEQCENFVALLLVNSGGLPRAVQWAEEVIFDIPYRFPLEKYYTAPEWSSVEMCLKGTPVDSATLSVSKAISKQGLRVDDDHIPTLPPFQLRHWAESAKNDDNPKIANVAKIIWNMLPLSPPSSIGDAANDGGMRLTFEMVTQASELIQHHLYDARPVRVDTLFPAGGAVHNMDGKTLRLHPMIRDTTVWNYPQDLFLEGHSQKLDTFIQGGLLVAPANPNNTATDYGCAVEISADLIQFNWVQQHSQNKFKDKDELSIKKLVEAIEVLPCTRDSVKATYQLKIEDSDVTKAKDKYASLLSSIEKEGVDLPKAKLVVLYGKREKVCKDDLPNVTYTIVVLRKGYQRLLSGLGNVALTFDYKTK